VRRRRQQRRQRRERGAVSRHTSKRRLARFQRYLGDAPAAASDTGRAGAGTGRRNATILLRYKYGSSRNYFNTWADAYVDAARGSRAPAVQSAFDMSIDGTTQDVDHPLMSWGDGSYVLAEWLEKASWSRATLQAIAVRPQPPTGRCRRRHSIPVQTAFDSTCATP